MENRKSIIDMAMGAFKERIDLEMTKVLANISDLNTVPTKKRTITATIAIEPDAQRHDLRIGVEVKSKLCSANPVYTTLCVVDTDKGAEAYEMVPSITGQTRMDGNEQSEPAVLKLVKEA